jgi:hypothetical protein
MLAYLPIILLIDPRDLFPTFAAIEMVLAPDDRSTHTSAKLMIGIFLLAFAWIQVLPAPPVSTFSMAHNPLAAKQIFIILQMSDTHAGRNQRNR